MFTRRPIFSDRTRVLSIVGPRIHHLIGPFPETFIYYLDRRPSPRYSSRSTVTNA